MCIEMRRAVGFVGRHQSASGQKYSWLVSWEKPIEGWCKVNTDEVLRTEERVTSLGELFEMLMYDG